MSNHSEAFIAFDSSKLRNAVAIADCGRAGEIRFLGEIENSTTATATAKLVRKLAGKYERLTFCYEAGPTGYELYRQIKSLGHECIVVAPSLIPKRPGDRVKTNRRDAVSLAKAEELNLVQRRERSHGRGNSRGYCEADGKIDARSQARIAPDENTDMREPANKSLLTDVSRLRSYRCTIIASTTSNELVERTGPMARLELDMGHKRVICCAIHSAVECAVTLIALAGTAGQ
jgi:hypothetical protein